MNKNVTAVILIVLALGLYLTVTKGIYDEAKAISVVNDGYASAIKSAEQLVKVRDQVLKDYNNLSQDNRDRLDKMLPSTVDNIRLIIDMNSVALRHGLSLKGIRASADTPSSATPSRTGQVGTPPSPIPSGSTPGSVISTPTLDTVKISFSVTAPYQQFISFMQDLEANLRIMDVTHLTVTSSDSGQYDFAIELKTYWLRQQ